ncbi:hypothetical protein CPAR01_13087 [Colletotrichum paranaense]|uniref:Uncharacterized protein n=1 Tax=Colletotrichum paranaense TaxID=1914294 RepID=A0ABQ9S501_9PEZI|nr:uncharacterized protein CPAR01_13087 [Colletotrichum paranaense]KAK1526559.1 hypothetical protein CPAR01_13087 [Colletotrichum paranaense]
MPPNYLEPRSFFLLWHTRNQDSMFLRLVGQRLSTTFVGFPAAGAVFGDIILFTAPSILSTSRCVCAGHHVVETRQLTHIRLSCRVSSFLCSCHFSCQQALPRG